MIPRSPGRRNGDSGPRNTGSITVEATIEGQHVVGSGYDTLSGHLMQFEARQGMINDRQETDEEETGIEDSLGVSRGPVSASIGGHHNRGRQRQVTLDSGRDSFTLEQRGGGGHWSVLGQSFRPCFCRICSITFLYSSSQVEVPSSRFLMRWRTSASSASSTAMCFLRTSFIRRRSCASSA